METGGSAGLEKSPDLLGRFREAGSSLVSFSVWPDDEGMVFVCAGPQG